jgi:hypothetical protein
MLVELVREVRCVAVGFTVPRQRSQSVRVNLRLGQRFIMADNQIELRARLKVLTGQERNQACVDCSAPLPCSNGRPAFAVKIVVPGSRTIGAWCCKDCSRCHRTIGYAFSELLRSVDSIGICTFLFHSSLIYSGIDSDKR